jgi:putative tryptophan/tyrosine transport system substrate-binding protein
MRALRSIRPVVVAIGLLATALTPEAQPGGKIHRIGWLTPSAPPPPGTPSSDIDAFKDGLRALGYVEGQHFTLEARFGDARFDRLPALAAELIAR